MKNPEDFGLPSTLYGLPVIVDDDAKPTGAAAALLATGNRPEFQNPSRRWKYVSVLPEDVLKCLSLDLSTYITRLALPPLPVGYRVLDVNWSWFDHCFHFMIEHNSFPEVPEGEQIPRVEGWTPFMVERRAVALVEGDSDLPIYREIK